MSGSRDIDSLYVADLLRFLQQWGWTSDLNLVNFFASGSHLRLPPEWVTALEALDTEQATALLGLGPRQDASPPSLPAGEPGRTAPSTATAACSPNAATDHASCTAPETCCDAGALPPTLREYFSTALCLRRPVQARLRPARTLSQRLKGVKGMTPKKEHEVVQLATVVEELCERHGCDTVVDVGSGSGYLLLALGQLCPGLRLCGIEGAQSVHKGALVRADQVLPDGASGATLVQARLHYDQREENVGVLAALFASVRAQGAPSGGACSAARAVERERSPSESAPSLQSEAAQGETAAPEHDNVSSPTLRALVVGLHCCGDLTPSILNAFLDSPDVACVACVGCCYHALARVDDGGSGGVSATEPRRVSAFPLSRTVAGTIDALSASQRAEGAEEAATTGGAATGFPGLSPHSFRSATQATPTAVVADDRRMRLAAYRAVLEVALRQCRKEGLLVHRLRLHVSRATVVETFSAYLELVFRDATVESAQEGNLPEPGCKAGEQHSGAAPGAQSVVAAAERCYANLRPHLGALKAALVLQAAVDPLVEGLIAADRSLYLQEAGCAAYVLPIFDAALSPRNCAIVASKPGSEAVRG